MSEVSEELPQIEHADFGTVLRCLKQGRIAYRKGWNGVGIHIALQMPDESSKMDLPYIYISTHGLVSDNEDAPRGIVPWLASQTDMLAEDWVIVKEVIITKL